MVDGVETSRRGFERGSTTLQFSGPFGRQRIIQAEAIHGKEGHTLSLRRYACP